MDLFLYTTIAKSNQVIFKGIHLTALIRNWYNIYTDHKQHIKLAYVEKTQYILPCWIRINVMEIFWQIWKIILIRLHLKIRHCLWWATLTVISIPNVLASLNVSNWNHFIKVFVSNRWLIVSDHEMMYCARKIIRKTVPSLTMRWSTCLNIKNLLLFSIK